MFSPAFLSLHSPSPSFTLSLSLNLYLLLGSKALWIDQIQTNHPSPQRTWLSAPPLSPSAASNPAPHLARRKNTSTPTLHLYDDLATLFPVSTTGECSTFLLSSWICVPFVIKPPHADRPVTLWICCMLSVLYADDECDFERALLASISTTGFNNLYFLQHLRFILLAWCMIYSVASSYFAFL